MKITKSIINAIFSLKRESTVLRGVIELQSFVSNNPVVAVK